VDAILNVAETLNRRSNFAVVSQLHGYSSLGSGVKTLQKLDAHTL
jgi:hypothetical protein